MFALSYYRVAIDVITIPPATTPMANVGFCDTAFCIPPSPKPLPVSFFCRSTGPDLAAGLFDTVKFAVSDSVVFPFFGERKYAPIV